ncbi:OmpA family protein [Cellvibrio sp. NN19]|uniref:OmpA family protein n=1 Tax=Cellvibrio chitinivorans TaxID=3102792 RepID=UPI002B40BAA2|nr:OmpA family protein [Cellvibrio sp. NN19]
MKPYSVFFCGLIAIMLSACQAHVEKPYSSAQILDLKDTDKDGVINARDICDGTAPTSEVDVQGCARALGDLAQRDFVLTFDMASYHIKEAQKPLLDDAASLVRNYPGAKVLLVGDTSPEGTDAINHRLGTQRADVVTKELIARGVAPQLITGFVYDESLMQTVMKKRERRTIVRVQYPGTTAVEKWDIYNAELKAKNRAGGKK